MKHRMCGKSRKGRGVIPEFYSRSSEWPVQIDRIGELLGRVSAIDQVTRRAVEVRCSNRIRSVHASAAIEGNTLTLAQVNSLAQGTPVFAPPREVQEIENALKAYDALPNLNPWSADDFLRAHALLTAGLIPEAGRFRTVEVEIVNQEGEVLHTGSRADKVSQLISELLQWGRDSGEHPVIVSSAVHFLIEQIHPFRDGNGRIGRLWQTLILSSWRPTFAWVPTEGLIHQHQRAYYEELQASRVPEIDAKPFIDYMLTILIEALRSYEAQVSEEAASSKDALKRSIARSTRASAQLEGRTVPSSFERSAQAEEFLAELRQRGLLQASVDEATTPG